MRTAHVFAALSQPGDRYKLYMTTGDICLQIGLSVKRSYWLKLTSLGNSCVKCYVAFLKMLLNVLNRNINGKFALPVDRKDIKVCLGDEKSKSLKYSIYIYIYIYHIISYHIISYHIISYHIISYHIISYHIISLTAQCTCCIYLKMNYHDSQL